MTVIYVCVKYMGYVFSILENFMFIILFFAVNTTSISSNVDIYYAVSLHRLVSS
jgi:hypothetical protein